MPEYTVHRFDYHAKKVYRMKITLEAEFPIYSLQIACSVVRRKIIDKLTTAQYNFIYKNELPTPDGVIPLELQRQLILTVVDGVLKHEWVWTNHYIRWYEPVSEGHTDIMWALTLEGITPDVEFEDISVLIKNPNR